MIRDPSDGSVREPRKPMVSGMPEPDQHAKDELERLNKSREWLKDYHKAMSINSTNKSGEKINISAKEPAE